MHEGLENSGRLDFSCVMPDSHAEEVLPEVWLSQSEPDTSFIA